MGGDETLTVIDELTGPEAGTENSIAIGADGLPVISYADHTLDAVKVLKCNDLACAGGDDTISIVSSGTYGRFTSIAIGIDGFPVISYYDNMTGDLKVAKCRNASCYN